MEKSSGSLVSVLFNAFSSLQPLAGKELFAAEKAALSAALSVLQQAPQAQGSQEQANSLKEFINQLEQAQQLCIGLLSGSSTRDLVCQVITQALLLSRQHMRSCLPLLPTVASSTATAASSLSQVSVSLRYGRCVSNALPYILSVCASANEDAVSFSSIAAECAIQLLSHCSLGSVTTSSQTTTTTTDTKQATSDTGVPEQAVSKFADRLIDEMLSSLNATEQTEPKTPKWPTAVLIDAFAGVCCVNDKSPVLTRALLSQLDTLISQLSSLYRSTEFKRGAVDIVQPLCKQYIPTRAISGSVHGLLFNMARYLSASSLFSSFARLCKQSPHSAQLLAVFEVVFAGLACALDSNLAGKASQTVLLDLTENDWQNAVTVLTCSDQPSTSTTDSASDASLGILDLPSLFNELADAHIYRDTGSLDKLEPRIPAFITNAEHGLRIWTLWLDAVQFALPANTGDVKSTVSVGAKAAQSVIRTSLPSLVFAAARFNVHDGKRIGGLLLEGESSVDWVSADTQALSERVLYQLAAIASPSLFSSLVSGSSPSSPSVVIQQFLSSSFAKICPALRARMRAGKDGSAWKNELWPRHVVGWLLREGYVIYPHIGEQLGDALPMVLVMVDDHQVPNKVLGLRALLHLIRNVNATELRWFRHFITPALSKCLAFRDPPVVEVLLPCFAESLMMIFPRPLTAITTSPTTSTLSVSVSRSPAQAEEDAKAAAALQAESRELFEQIINELDYLALTPSIKNLQPTEIYLRESVLLFMFYGLALLEHFHRLWPIMCGLCIREEPSLRRYSFLALATLLQSCWPRVPAHQGSALELLLAVYLRSVESEQQEQQAHQRKAKMRVGDQKAGIDMLDEMDDSKAQYSDEEIKRTREAVLGLLVFVHDIAGPSFKVLFDSTVKDIAELLPLQKAFETQLKTTVKVSA